MVNTNLPGFTIRFAEKKDAPLVVKYIRDLASYEDELDYVSVTADILEKYMFDQHGAECLLGESNGNPVGFAFFHESFSTFLGKPGIALVDLYIEPEMRGCGYGKSMLSCLANIAKERDCGRLEWWVHDWNEPAAEHYRNWGAKMVKDIRVYRMDGSVLDKFSKQF
ncbi:GNAT family N-acetyltransferase [Aminipila sp.]|uniref:GNAT family N-acetyltransferase n=1 Tax=Aminipila sp. TaxID=2060095 RepID=UPI00289C679A|nr:GNAT family N-acetyltransferase [Aminipila sp.]